MGAAAPVISAVAAVGGLGYGIYSGEQGRKLRKRGLQMQEQAQRQAMAAASSQKRASAEASRKVNQKQPDIMALLAANQAPRQSATNLTGPLGLGGGTRQLGL